MKILFLGASIVAFSFGVATLTGGAIAGDEKISDKAAAKLAGFERTGETRRCLPLHAIKKIDALDDYNLLFSASGGDLYLNVPRGRCARADSAFTRFQYKMSGSQLCNLQLVEIVDNSSGMTVGACSLGRFERLEERAPEDEAEAEAY